MMDPLESVEPVEDGFVVELPLNPRMSLGGNEFVRLGNVVAHGRDPGAERASMGRGLREDGLQQGFIFPFGNGEEVLVVHLHDGVFDVPGDGKEAFEIRGNLQLLELAMVPLDEILEVFDRGAVEGTAGNAEEFPVLHHLGHLLNQLGMFLLVLLQGQPEIFFRFPELRTVSV